MSVAVARASIPGRVVSQAARRGIAKQAAAPDNELMAEIDGLRSLDLDALRSRWLALMGKPAPKGFRRDLLMRALAHEMQVAAFGGLSSALIRRLRQLTVGAREDRFDEVLGTSSLKPGTLLMRIWQGQTHRVMVTRDGYVWNGDPYGSLSTITKLITGTSWNGWTFFGVKKPSGRNKNAAGRRAGGRPDAHTPLEAGRSDTEPADA